MAKKGGFFQAMGNLARWTIWGLAGVLVLAIWLAWSNRAGGPDTDIVASSEEVAPETTADQPADMTSSADAEQTIDAGDEDGGSAPVVVLEEAVSNSLAEIQGAVEDAVDSANEAMSDSGSDAGGSPQTDVASGISEALEAGPGSDEAPATELEEAVGAAEEVADTIEERIEDLLQSPSEEAAEEALEAADAATDETVSVEAETSDAAVGAISDRDADLNILPEEFSEIRIPGDSAVYGLSSVFQRDDGSIEVISSRTEGDETVLTTRLVTCAPLAAGVIAEGDGPRNETPELVRIPLGDAAAMIAAMACGAMN